MDIKALSTTKQSFYQVHWYVYPVIYWLELLVDFLCLEQQSFDVAYMTELDPLWNADELSFILNPEAALFGNPIAQAACAADCAATSAGFPMDMLFWCGGCQGSLYPFTGNNHGSYWRGSSKPFYNSTHDGQAPSRAFALGDKWRKSSMPKIPHAHHQKNPIQDTNDLSPSYNPGAHGL